MSTTPETTTTTPLRSTSEFAALFPGGPYPGPRLTEIATEPPIRVRVRRGVDQVTVEAEGALRLRGDVGRAYRYAAPLTLRRDAGAWVIRDPAGRGVRWPVGTLRLTAEGGGPMTLGENTYPATLALTPRSGGTGGDGVETGTFDVVNHVPLETYLPGVIERELYGGWPLETFKAQAVAARSYALWERTIAPSRHYDLESTTASQVYGGKATDTRALRAVAETRGQALAFRGRVVPAFFSSSAGGRGQDATLAFPNRVEELAPLRAREHGSWDRQSPTYRWGPVERPTATLSRRIAGWGQRRSHPVAGLGTLARVEVAGRNRVGRPAVYRLTDTAGRTFRIDAESFRNACNHTADGTIPLEKPTRLLSSDVDIAVSGAAVRFTGGRGHGHGVGLSQWGAMAMARAGHGYTAILDFYYPGARLARLY
ncbi:MAG: SpoIID/LytB domain-containing protein [Planctomycetota bacterium]